LADDVSAVTIATAAKKDLVGILERLLFMLETPGIAVEPKG
jgi:hypothetical protein